MFQIKAKLLRVYRITSVVLSFVMRTKINIFQLMQYVLYSAPNLYFNLTFNGIASVHFKYCPKLFDHKINFHAYCIVAWHVLQFCSKQENANCSVMDSSSQLNRKI